MNKHSGVWVVGILLLAGATGARPQDAKKEYDLAWKLPHDRAAIYDLFDAAKKTKRGEFWLLGCELSSRVGAMEGSDLPFRFVLRTPREKVKVGARWEVRETAFGDLIEEMEKVGMGKVEDVQGDAVAPVEIVGVYRLKEVKSVRVEEVFKIALKERKDKSEPVEVGVIEGQFEISRCRRDKGRWVAAEKTASTSLGTMMMVRVSDGAILGGRYQWRGRLENYKDFNGTGVAKVEEGCEIVLREPLVELSRAGLKARIDKAVRAGSEWLKGRRDKEGRISEPKADGQGTYEGTGGTALAVLALVHSGVGVDDAVVKAAYSYLLSKELKQSYDAALRLMAIEGKYLPLEKFEDIEAFSEEKAREDIAKRITKEDKAVAEAAARWLIEIQASNGSFGYGHKSDQPNLSNTHYALLGLKSASRMGVAVPGSVWKRALGFIETGAVFFGGEVTVNVERRGGKGEEHKGEKCGWQYRPPKYPELTGTMVSAALVGISICRSELARAGEWDDAIAKKTARLEWGGIGWLQEYYGVRTGMPEGCWPWGTMPYFYLYSLERAGIMLEIGKISGHDWYLEGAAVLLSWQRSDGRWESSQRVAIVETAFALLFLKRATIPVATPSSSPKK